MFKGDRLVSFGLMASLLTLAPVLPLAGRVMYHNLYFSLFGLSLLAGAFVATISQVYFEDLDTRLANLRPPFASTLI